MKKVMVALVTPFDLHNKVDFKALGQIVRRLIKEGVDGFIVCGTTAETPTLTHNEKMAILRYVIEISKQRVEIWFGCGTNDTNGTIQACIEAEKEAIDGVLLVTPYYNRPNDEGIFAHYDKIAESIHTNIMLYNVPSRTGIHLNFDVIKRLIEKHDNITSLKQASSDLKTVRLLKQYYPDYLIYSGEDAYFDEGFEAGMDGLISVMGHVGLLELKEFITQEDVSHNTWKKLKELTDLTFCDSSPAPIKYMLSLRNECRNIVRLPLVPIQIDKQKRIQEFIDKKQQSS